MALPAGCRLGAYEIVSSLGAGGMGEVHRARDSRLGRDVALKVLPPDVTDDPSRLERFDRVARAIAALNHPHIVVPLGFDATEKDRRGSQRQLPYDGAVPAPSP
jgi:eukaryotic-like serine/threonine-protein kinase